MKTWGGGHTTASEKLARGIEMTKSDSPDDREGIAPDWRDLHTEARHPLSTELDLLGTHEVAGRLLAEDQLGLMKTRESLREIGDAAARFADTLEAGGDVVFAGAGTSGRLGVIEAAECPPTFGTDPQRIRAVIAGGPDAVFRSQEGSEDRAEDGRRDVSVLGPDDLLIGLSASSVTPYVRAALDQARERGIGTILITCAAGEGLEASADLVLALDTGPEVLAGSTRLKAGSATKAVLNAITTAAMVRLGKVYDGMMVDLKLSSAKLRDRALRIVESVGDVDRDRAERLLATADDEVKTAIVMARRGLDADGARDRLVAAGGQLRRALD